MRSRLSATEDVLQLELEGREKARATVVVPSWEHNSQARHVTDPEGILGGGRCGLLGTRSPPKIEPGIQYNLPPGYAGQRLLGDLQYFTAKRLPEAARGVVQNRRLLGNTDVSERSGFEAGFRSAGCRVQEAGRPPRVTLAGAEARRGPTTSTSADGFRRSIIPAGCVRFAPRVDCV
jgi:hypothetical protein